MTCVQGHDTTASTIGFVVYTLAAHPEVQVLTQYSHRLLQVYKIHKANLCCCFDLEVNQKQLYAR